MKKSLIALAVLGSFAGFASAQSSVTVFGTIDAAVTHIKNGSNSVTGLATDGNSASRLGVRGVEDLGGGTAAEFWLESALSTDTGVAGNTAGSFWNRRATVGLKNSSLGEVRLGRDYVPTYTAQCAFDPFNCVGVAQIGTFRSTNAAVIGAATGAALTSANPLVRANNSVQYITPGNLGGFVGQLFASAGEGNTTGATENSKSQGGRVGYLAGPINVQAAYLQIKNLPGAAAGATLKDAVLGGSYDFGMVKLALSRRDVKVNAEKLAQTAVSLTAPVSAAGTVKAQYIKANQSGSVQANDASLIGLGYQHDLSKRTALYATVARISNKGGATFANTINSGVPAIAAGEKSMGYQLGLRHNF